MVYHCLWHSMCMVLDMVIFLPITWLLLTRVLHPIRVRSVAAGQRYAHDALRALGPMKRGEWSVMAVFAVTVSLWMTLRHREHFFRSGQANYSVPEAVVA